MGCIKVTLKLKGKISKISIGGEVNTQQYLIQLVLETLLWRTEGSCLFNIVLLLV